MQLAIQYLVAARKDKNYKQVMENAKSRLIVQRSMKGIENESISSNLSQEDED